MAFAIFSFTCGSALAQTTNTNTVINGGTINVSVTEVITNPVTSITAAITNNGSLQFWQSTALTDSGIISGIGTVTKALNSGNLTLSGSNTFSGKVTVSSGTLFASGASDTVGSGLGLGTQVELGGSGANLQVTVGAGATNTTSRQLILNNSATLGNGGNGSLVWNGNTVFNTNTTASLLFNSGGTGTNVFGGIIGNTTNNSAVNLNFQATQIWSLTGSNTFSGGITIGGGRVIADKLANIGTASSIGTAGNIRFGYFNNARTTFEYVGSGSTNNIQVKLGASAGTGNNAGSFLHNGTGALVLNNAVFTLASDVQAANMSRVLVLGGTNAADNTIAGVIANADGASANSTVSIVKDGVGKWILSGASTYTGGTVISNGILQIGVGGTTGSVLGAITNNGTLILSRSGNPNFTNVISGSGPVLIASNASLTLSGASTFGGKVTAAGSSTLYAMGVADSGTSALGTNNQVELGSDPNSNRAALYVNVAAGTTNTTARELIANGPSFTLGNYSNGVLVWNGNTTFNRGTNSSFAFALGAFATSTNVFAGVIGDTTPDIDFETTAPVNMTVTGASIWSLTGSNTFSGGVTLTDGKLIVSSLDNGASSIGTGNFRMGGFANVPVLEYVGSGSTNNRRLTLGAGPAATGGRILANGTGALVFTNANFLTGANVQTAGLNRAVIFGGTNTADNAITGIIANVNPTNTVSIVKEDAGKWVLSGNNTYTGGTTISNGILQIGAGGTTGSLQGSIANNGSLIFDRSDATTVTNAISGSGSVTKKAANILTLSGANTFSGDVTVGVGTLIATGVADSGSSSLGTGTQLALGGSATASFTANSSSTTARSLVLGGTGGSALKNSGSGALVWSGNVINNTTANGADFTLGGSGAGGNEFSGLLTNNGVNAMRLIKNETGTWKLSGANTFTSLLDVFDGTLVVTTMANSGTASSVGAGTTIRFGGWASSAPVLEYVGSGSTNNKQFKLGGGGTANTGGTILNNGTGALVFNNATFNAAGDGAFSGTTRALTLGGSNSADNAISGVIGNNNAGASTNNTVSVVKDGTGKWILSGSNTYSGITTVNAGNLVVERTNLTATILSNSIAVAFSSAPSAATYTILPGALAGNSLASPSVIGLGSGQTATVVNSPNLVVQVTDGAAGPTFDSLYEPGTENALGSNGLSNLMNYALGGTGPTSNPALPVLTSSGTSLTLTANIRDSGQGVDVIGQYTYDLAGPWNDVPLTPTGASSSVANTTVQSFTQNVEAGRPKKFMRFKATKNP